MTTCSLPDGSVRLSWRVGSVYVDWEKARRETMTKQDGFVGGTDVTEIRFGPYPLPKHAVSSIEARNKIDAARYYVHKLRMKMYGDAVSRGEMCAEEAMHHYRQSMANYDDVINAAANGCLSEANARQMEEDIENGFGGV